jgi:hypothetical protein
MTSQPKIERLSLIVVGIALGAFLIHLAVNLMSPYGFHRDEFLYLAMGEHLQLWQMDFPPLIAVLANISRAVFGDSLASIRFFPAAAGSLLIVLAADIARRLGGKAFSQTVSALAMLMPTIFLRPGNLFQPVVFDQLWWTLGLWCLLRWRESGNTRWWVYLGIVMGIGLFTKFSILFFGCGVLVGLLVTSDRRMLRTRWPWIALALTVLIGLPSLIGQLRLGFPVIGQMQDLQSRQLVHVSWSGFVVGQFMMLQLSSLVALTGIIALLTAKRFAQYRILGWVFVGSFTLLFLTHGKNYYLGPIYPAMIGAGAVVMESVGSGRWKTVFRASLMVLLFTVGLVTVPLGLPILPPPDMEQYTQRLGINEAVKTNTGDLLRLPQDYADMLGWEEQVKALADVYQALSPEQRTHTVIFAGNYGEAGAIDFFGPRYGLPHALCVNGTYWYFGPGSEPGTSVLTIGIGEKRLKGNWTNVTLKSQITNTWAVLEEQRLAVYFCEDELKPIQALWPGFAGRH